MTEKLQKILNEQRALAIFLKMKFDRIAIEPLSGEPENIIEVINQIQTYLVSIDAMEYLFDKYPDKK